MKHLLCLIITAVLLGVSGCTSADSDRGRYDRIAKDLETGGSCYFISSSRQSGAALSDLVRQCEKYTWDSSLPDETRFKLQRLISSCELWARLAGIGEIKGWGGSSRQLPAAKRTLFRNKLRVLLSEQRSGVLWNLFPKENIPLENQLYGLPHDTFFAGAVSLSPVVLQQIIDSDKDLSAPVSDFSKLFFDMTVAELAAELSGIWRIVMVCDEKNIPDLLAGIHISLTLPDRKGRLFKKLSEKMKFLPGTTVDLQKKTIKLEKVPEKMCIPYAVGGNGTLTLSTSPRSYHRTHPLKSFPALPSFVKPLSRYNRLEGIGVFYSRDITDLNLSGSVDTNSTKEALAVVRALPDGVLVEDISPCDLNAYAILSTAAAPLHFILGILSAPPPQKKSSLPPPPPSPAPGPRRGVKPVSQKVETPPQSSRCTAGIANAGKALLKAVKKSNTWHAPGIAGLRSFAASGGISAALLRCPETKLPPAANGELNYANCHYLYFGKPGTNSPKSPILMELPFLHKDHIAVFYADGSVEELRLSGRRNVRRAVSFLHTVHSYEEEEFIRLIQFASELDKILER